jgi:hypothetical protein
MQRGSGDLMFVMHRAKLLGLRLHGILTDDVVRNRLWNGNGS